MPLPKPILDNRTFDQLVEEGRSLLPRLAPTWTDHNYSDPGITLLELFAWFTEMELYRLDFVTEEQQRGFLRLVGVAPRAAQVARTVLLLESSMERALPAGLQMGGDAGMSLFQSQSALTVSAAQLAHIIAGGAPVALPADSAGFLPFGATPQPDAALYLGFDAPLATPGAELSAWIWTTTPVEDLATRARLIEEWEHAARVRATTCPPTLTSLPGWWLHHDAVVAWEYFATGEIWKPLEVVLDETRALTLSGPVRWLAPADHVPGGPAPGSMWIRARLASGGYECPTPLACIGFNAVEVAHAAEVEPVQLVNALGHASSRYELKQSPVVAGSTRLDVEVAAVAEGEWREVANWDLTGPHDRHYLLDAELGIIAFGDGWRGRVVPDGATQAVAFRIGGGAGGNVAAHALEQWADNAHNAALVIGWSAIAATLAIEQPQAALGGAPAESIKDAMARAIALLAATSRAVTLADFENLAREVPGVAVARSRAIADLHPVFTCYRAAGSITVVVVPNCPGPEPTPTPGMLAAVRAYLDRRRTPGSELHVVAPTYTTVRVVATLQARADARPDEVRAAIVAALDDFFNPLHGGPGATGWPIGRDVYRSEILALLAGIPAVACVLALGLQGDTDSEPRCANLPVCDDSLIVPGEHDISVLGTPPIRIVDRSIPHECP